MVVQPGPDPEAVKLWYEELLLARMEVQATIDELRGRTGVLLTVIALTTTFFAAVATRSGTPPIGQSPKELTALALFLLAVLLLAFVFSPHYLWRSFARPGRVRRMVFDCAHPDVTTLRIQLGQKIPRDIHKDRSKLRALQWVFIVALVAFFGEIVMWVLAVLS